jgi:hypothetical protein
LQDEEEAYDCLLKSGLYMHNNRYSYARAMGGGGEREGGMEADRERDRL